MARIALIKVFTGLQMGVSQLSGELQRAGHDSLIIHFKDYVVAPHKDRHLYCESDLGGAYVAARGTMLNGNLYTPFSDREYELLIDTLERFDPQMIGFSLCSVQVKEVAQVTERVRAHFPGIPLIWGGVGATVEPERCLQYADMICVDEGEGAILELAERLDAGDDDFTGIRNIWTKKPDGEIVRMPSRPLVTMDEIAMPDYEPSRSVWIHDDKREFNVYTHCLGRQYHIMTQRGCPFSCSFCIESWLQDRHGKGASLRRMSVDRALEELRIAKEKYNPVAVMFYDDVFTVNSNWIREFAPRYKAEIGLPFWCYTYPRTTRKEDLDLLADAGCVSMSMGIQSGSGTVLKEYNRPVDGEISIKAAQMVVDSGIRGLFDLMTMGQYDTEETSRQTFEFLLRLPIGMQTVGFYPMNLFPNYGYTNKVKEQNKQSELSEEDYFYWHKLFLLTRTKLPRRIVRALGNSRLVRRFPTLLDPLLPDKLPFFYLDNGALDLEKGTISVRDTSGHEAGAEEFDVPQSLRRRKDAARASRAHDEAPRAAANA